MEPPSQLDASGREDCIVHYLVPGLKFLACSQSEQELPAQPHRPYPHQRSDDVRAVTCRLCKESSYYREAKRLLDHALKQEVFTA